MINQLRVAVAPITDFIKKWYLLSSAIGLAILVYLLDSKNKNIGQLKDQIVQLKLAEQIKRLKEKAETDEKSFTEAASEYHDLKRIHADLFQRLGIGASSNPIPEPHRDEDSHSGS